MAQLDNPIVNSWYKLQDSETFRVTSFDSDEGYIEIQYLDGTLEGLDIEVWIKLGAEQIEPSEEWLEELEQDINELDFYQLGAAPGSEAFDVPDYFSEESA